MENLDDFMRQKFNTDPDASGERFEFREEYWEQAQALLEAEEKQRRKRRRWLIWWMFFGAVAVAVAVYSNNARHTNQSIGKAGNNERRNAEGQGQMTENSQHSEETNGIRAQGDTSTKNFSREENTAGAGSALLKNKVENQGFETKNGNAGTEGAYKQQTEKNIGTQDAPRKSPLSRTTPLPSGNGLKRAPSAAESTKISGVEMQKAQQPTQPGLPVSDNTNKIQSPPGQQTDSTNFSAIAQNDLDAFNDFAVLPTLTGLLDLPKRDLDTPFITPFVRPIEPVRERRFEFGLATAGTLSQASPDGKRLGAVGGVFLDYRFASTWSLSTGANWRYLTGAWATDTAPTQSQQLHYSFGYQQNTWNLETKGLHFLEIPLGLRWQHGIFSATAGFAPGFLLGVQGKMTHEYAASLQAGVTTEQKRVWLSKTPYYQFAPAVFLGGEWQATRRLGLTLRGTCRPGAIGAELNPDEPPPSNLFWLDAGLRWYF